MKENINLIGDCIETVYNLIDKKSIQLPLETLKDIIDQKTKPDDFEIIKTIAKGGYGEVYLVKSDKVYAMKRVAKEDILKQPFTSLFMAEKKLLTESVNSEWLVSAKMTLQDNEYLYYLMDYIPGGDFMGLLSKEDTLEEKWVKFYTVEIICALDELHKLGWIHRDLKPDNILIGKDGHIKLADFGSSIKMENKKAKSTFVVGTPDYISPDILESSNVENEYSENVDFWTLGVIIYEMLFGVTPFYSNSLVETYRKIVDLEYNFPFNISEKIKDLIQKLIQKKDKRLNIYEIKKHPFFEGVDWENIKSMVPPYIPEILDEFDTSNFYDTAFEMKTRNFISTPNFIDFVGFSHDPMLEKAVRKLFLNEKEIKNENVPIIKENDEVKNNKKLLNEIQAQILETNQKLQDKQNEYKEIIINILSEKDDLDSIENELKIKKKQLQDILKEISDKKQTYDEFIDINTKTKNLSINFGYENGMKFDIESIKNDILIVLSKLSDCQEQVNVLDSIFKDFYSCHKLTCIKYKRNIEYLVEKNDLLEKENNKLKKNDVDNLKKQVRLMTSEIKEYQQKLDMESSMRKRLEDELKSVKNEKKVSKLMSNQVFNCKIVLDNKKLSTEIKIINDMFYLSDKSCTTRNVYILELKNNELYHESYKIRSLTLKIIFIKEQIKSVSSSGRRNIKSLEEDLSIELCMKEGLEQMISLLSGKQLEDARLQYEGSLKKISQLNKEMEIARKSTLTEEIPDDPIKLYEFNNHLFASKTFPPGKLCEHCNEVLYGLKDQGFECKDCKMVVHKSCYILGNVSCETYNAFKKGDHFYVLMRSIEEKEKLIELSKDF